MPSNPTAVTVTCVKIDKRPDGQIWVTWGDGSTQYFPSLADVQAVGNEWAQNPESAQMLMLRFGLARSPDLSNTATIVGKSLTLDLSANNPIVVR